MCRFLVEHGACIYSTTHSDKETAAQKCEEDEADFEGCSQYLLDTLHNLGRINDGVVYAAYDYQGKLNLTSPLLHTGNHCKYETVNGSMNYETLS